MRTRQGNLCPTGEGCTASTCDFLVGAGSHHCGHDMMGPMHRAVDFAGSLKGFIFIGRDLPLALHCPIEVAFRMHMTSSACTWPTARCPRLRVHPGIGNSKLCRTYFRPLFHQEATSLCRGQCCLQHAGRKGLCLR